MSDLAAERPRAPAVFNIPTHRSFADSLVAGLISRFGKLHGEVERTIHSGTESLGGEVVGDAWCAAWSGTAVVGESKSE